MHDRESYPPRFTTWLLAYLACAHNEDVLGDMEEEFHTRSESRGSRHANFWYLAQAAYILPTLLITDFYLKLSMLKNYFVTAVRSLRKYRGYTAINVLGLAVGMATCLLVINIVRDQKSYDTFHASADNIIRLISRVEEIYGPDWIASSPAPVGPALEAAYDEVEASVRFSKFSSTASTDEQSYSLEGLYTEPSYFEIFDFRLASGDEDTALDAPFSLILSKEMAEKFFMDTDPLGQIIERKGVGEFTVTGVLEDPPLNTHLETDALASLSTLAALQIETEDWDDPRTYYTYLLLAPGTSREAIVSGANRLLDVNANREGNTGTELLAQELPGLALTRQLSNQVHQLMRPKDVTILYIFTGILLLTAMFNYVSLSVARSLKRAREIGIRKVAGANRSQVIGQFLSESIVMTFIAFGIALLLLQILIPEFSKLENMYPWMAKNHLAVNVTKDAGLLLQFLGLATLVGILAGAYPAFVMSRFTPTRTLKGTEKIQGFSGMSMRRVLIVAQFSLSIFAVTITIITFRQLKFMTSADYGLGEDQTVNIELQETDFALLRDELKRVPGVESVSVISGLPGLRSDNSIVVQSDEMETGRSFRSYAIDASFIDQFGLEVIAGEGFAGDYVEAVAVPIILSRLAVRYLSLESPEEAIGLEISAEISNNITRAYVIGVVEDFQAQPLEDGFEPVLLHNVPDAYRFAAVQLGSSDLQATLKRMEAAWANVAAPAVIRYDFYRDQLTAGFESIYSDIIKFFGFMAFIIITLACLGLLGMASYSSETRTKEVGVRRVLGADTSSLLMLLSKDYIILLAISLVISVPASYLIGESLSQSWATRAELSFWIFPLGITPIIALALLAIGSQTLKASLVNPVEMIRNE